MDKKTIFNRLKIYINLMRINKPAGLFLLLWPTLWSLFLSKLQFPNIKILLIFFLGTFIMRSAGCVINDFFDYKIDKKIKRTKNRMLPTKKVRKKEVFFLFFF